MALLLSDVENFTRVLGGALGVSYRVPYVDLGGVVEVWPDLNDFLLLSAHAEFRLFLSSTEDIAPFVAVGGGYMSEHYRGASDNFAEWSGASGMSGLGLQGDFASAQVRTGIFARTSGGGSFGASWRTTVGPSCRVVRPQTVLTDLGAGITVAHLSGLSGPWRAVDPAFGAFVRRRFGEATHLGIEAMVFHWQIPDDSGATMRDYIWDTRALALFPGFGGSHDEWLTVTGGPAIVLMGEGPGRGGSLGAHAVATASVPIVPLSLRLRGFWMLSNSDDDPTFGDGDQLGLLIGAALQF